MLLGGRYMPDCSVLGYSTVKDMTRVPLTRGGLCPIRNGHIGGVSLGWLEPGLFSKDSDWRKVALRLSLSGIWISAATLLQSICCFNHAYHPCLKAISYRVYRGSSHFIELRTMSFYPGTLK